MLKLTLLLCLIPAAAIAQQPSFEVATIKLSDPAAPHSMIGIMPTPDGIEAVMVTVPMLMRSAYGDHGSLLAGQVSSLPDWAKLEPYDVRGKFSDADREAMQKLPPAEQRQMQALMLQSLLAERFNLQLHITTKQFPAYDLVPSKGGPKIKPTSDDDSSLRKGDDGKPLHGFAMFFKNEMKVQQNTMLEFATLLSQQTGNNRPVIDKTGLTGVFSFTLHWSPNQPTGDTDSPSLFTVIQEDLGLKLQPSTTTLPVFIIDRLDRPTAN